MNEEKDLTPTERRLSDLNNVVDKFSEHLKTVPGSVLTPLLRLGVATCARDALVNCKDGCDTLSPHACLMKDSRFYKVCSDLNHGTPFPFLNDGDEKERRMSSCLRTIVHSVVMHQGRLNQGWYEDAVDELRNCALMSFCGHASKDGSSPEAIQEKSRDVSHQSALMEIILLSIMSHSIHIVFLTMGLDPPPLPTKEDMKNAPSPTNLDFTSLLHQVRMSERVGFAPFFIWKDVNIKSPEFSKLRESTRQNLSRYVNQSMGPQTAGFLAVEDGILFLHFMNEMYLPKKDVRSFSKSLSPENRCPSVFRTDLETVAFAVAKCHECNF